MFIKILTIDQLQIYSMIWLLFLSKFYWHRKQIYDEHTLFRQPTKNIARGH